jgi:Hint module
MVYKVDSDEAIQASGVIFPITPPPPKGNSPNRQPICVATRRELRNEVRNCEHKMNEPSCLIDVCSTKLPIVDQASTDVNGLDISTKNIVFNCEESCVSKRCIIDGMGISRMFYGSYTNITFQNFVFANGYHTNDGGSMKMENNSIVTLVNCSFVNNTAPFGSALVVSDSVLIVEGVVTSIVNNTGTGPPIQVLSSHLNLSNAMFVNNKASEYVATIFMFNSTINVYDVHFQKSATIDRGTTQETDSDLHDDCNIFVAVDANNFTKKSSCMMFDKSNKTVPYIDLSESCPSPAPPSASPTQSPITCFSGNNFVEIENGIHVPMSEIRIGDYVKSSGGALSQVYGFGHFCHDLKATFLRISFDTTNDNRTEPSQLAFLEISANHLIMKKKGDKTFVIRAGDIVVGDVLSGKRVETIQFVVRRGVYAPLTASGDIMVNGVLASNYVDILGNDMLVRDQHGLGHLLFTPQRMFCQYFIDICKMEMYINGYGILAYLLVGNPFVDQQRNILDDSYCHISLIRLIWGVCILFMLVVARYKTAYNGGNQ